MTLSGVVPVTYFLLEALLLTASASSSITFRVCRISFKIITIMSTPLAGPQSLPDTYADEKLAAFDSVPLFMKSLPEEADDDAAIAALQSLAFEGTPDGG